MCGIAGFFGTRHLPEAAQQAMLDALAQRGPDAQHIQSWDNNWSKPNDRQHSSNALIHTRLSIRDLREVADQPMGNHIDPQSSDIWICYNGEVYGWEPLRAELEALHGPFQTTGDTEFILRAYQAWGLDMLPKLRGMFAIAILDLRKQKLYLIRDRMGLKPILYWHDSANKEFAFASVVRGLLPYLPKGQKTLSTKAIDAFLTHRYIPAPLSIIDGVQRLENGHYLEYDLNSSELNKQQYWFPQDQPSSRDTTLGETLDQAVNIRTVSDRPLGLFLSGGIDSTVLASRLKHAGNTDLTCYTARFKGSSLDESEVAERSAKKLGLRHRNIDVPHDIDDAQFARIVADLDDPFADPSSFPMWYLSQAASREVKVVLGGDGGDEIFAGYKRYNKHLRTRWRHHWRLPGSPFNTDNKLVAELRSPWLQAYSQRFSGFSFPQRRQILNKTPRRHTWWRGLQTASKAPALDALLSIDRDNTLPEYILRKGDLCTMAHGLEMRCPLLDHAFFQQVQGLPSQQRYTQPAKLALKPWAEPVSEVFELKKRGFNPPLKHWLRNCWQARYLGLGERLQQRSSDTLDATSTDAFVQRYLDGEESLAERILQLLILDESLGQLIALGAQTEEGTH